MDTNKNSVDFFHSDINDRAQWDKLAATEKGRNAIRTAEDELAAPPEEVDFKDLYLDYSRTGRRKPYEDAYFKRKGLLGCFAFAECLENKGRFIKPMEDMIRKICSENTWMLPAHDPTLGNFNGQKTDIDLFSSQRGALLAFIYRMFGEKLSPEIRSLMKERIRARIVAPFKDMLDGKKSPGWMAQKYNWNSVCTANVTVACVCISDTEAEREYFINAASNSIKNYLSGFSKDGYCLEGMGYWNFGFGHYILFTETVRRATNGRVDPFLWENVGKMALFPFRFEVINKVYPIFADCPFDAAASDVFMGYIALRYDLGSDEYKNKIMGLSPYSMLFNCIFCFIDRDRVKCPASQRIELDNGPRTWFEDAQILICRGDKGVKSDFGAAFKGGLNAGPHHHLDVGSYTVICGKSPVLVDPGTEIYTMRSFGKDRFASKVLNSYGHPVPVINGKLQRKGDDTQSVIVSSDFSPGTDSVSFDIKAAYDDPTLKKLVRTFRFDRKNSSVDVEDSFEFDSPGTFENALITFGTFKKLPDGRLKISHKDRSVIVEISSDCGPVSVSSETIEENLPGGQKPLRIALKLDTPVSKGTVKVRISKENTEKSE